MTTKEKAKAYDEALKVLHKYDGANIMFTQDLKEEMFPELKESKDERIRKEIINHLILFNNGCYKIPSKDIIDNWIAWLEKQGEQKPADKVEPKFNEGDWVLFNNKHQSIYQVEKIEDGYYILRHTHGGIFRVCVLHDESLRLWTIQDAKDGDVLCTKNNCCPFIYDKGRYNNGLAYYYAGIDVSDNLNIKSPHNMLAHLGRLDNIRPATQEQRDLLFQKMKEAGYEWDAEKKELKKIEQKPVEHLELKAGHWYICHRAYCCRADHLTVKEGERFMCEKDGVVKGFVIKNPENYFKEVSAPAPIEDEQNPA